jgi:hypothetical protein
MGSGPKIRPKDPYCPPGSLCYESKVARRKEEVSAAGERTRRSGTGTGQASLAAAGGRRTINRASYRQELNQFSDHQNQTLYYDEDGNKYQPSNKTRNRVMSQGGGGQGLERMLSGKMPNLNNIGRNFTNAFQQNLPNAPDPRRPNGGYVGTYKDPGVPGGYVDLYKAGRAPPGMKRK